MDSWAWLSAFDYTCTSFLCHMGHQSASIFAACSKEACEPMCASNHIFQYDHQGCTVTVAEGACPHLLHEGDVGLTHQPVQHHERLESRLQCSQQVSWQVRMLRPGLASRSMSSSVVYFHLSVPGTWTASICLKVVEKLAKGPFQYPELNYESKSSCRK